MDFYVTVYPRPFEVNSQTLATAGFVQQAVWASWRPIQGAMNINMAEVPNRAFTGVRCQGHGHTALAPHVLQRGWSFEYFGWCRKRSD
jgi:hypothetical protein